MKNTAITTRSGHKKRKTLMYTDFYRALYRIRRVEEEISKIYPTDKIKSPVHLSIGQEAVAVGVCHSLSPDDVVFGSYRGHALYLAKGGNLNQMIAELYGKIAGCAKGKGGSMHLADVKHGVMGTSAVVASTIPNAVGYAYGLKYQHLDRIVVSLFGDGAVEEGVFYESLNFAALKKLPIIFICENNLYAIHSPLSNRQATNQLVERVRTFGIQAETIEGNDVLEIDKRVREAARAIRNERSGPAFFECMTYRWREHVGPNEDYNLGYRDRNELEPWIQNDQLERLAKLVTSPERDRIESEVETEIRGAFENAEASPFPDEKELLTHLFKEG
jgi:TPP-dependent pyruvate/acetoin dehydrogenase alpha subunit